MPPPKKKPGKHRAGKPGRDAKASAKPSKVSKPAPRKKLNAAKPAASKRKPAPKIAALDVSAFPPESIAVFEKWICLACVLDVFTRQLNLAPRTAHLEIKR